MENKTLREIFKEQEIFELYFENVDKIHLWLSYENKELCIELCDMQGNSVNINNGIYVNITLDTKVCDIKKMVLNYIVGNYLYRCC